ncbi:MAG: putative transporter substrate binding protein, partial [Chloroflexi bacterium]|nr:putative transporter substrate binding protein [Chloroflexota bacterium]
SEVVTVTKDNVQAAIFDSGYWPTSDFDLTNLTAAPAPAATTAPVSTYDGMKVEAPSCDYGGEFKSIEAVDEFTVKFTLCTPDPAFPSKVAFSAFAIQDKDYLDANGGSSAKMSEQPNGTGPYKVKEWVRGDHITFEANPDYWGTAPLMKTVIFRWSQEAAQRLLELQSGTVDGIDNPAPEDIATIESDSNLKLLPRTAGTIFYLGMNNTIKPFDNEQVRQAMAMAIDKKRIVDNFYQAGSSVAEQFVPPIIVPGFSTTGDGAKWYDYDPVKAKEMLAAAGYPDGFETTMSFRNVVRPYVSNQPQIAQDLQAQLAEIGVKVKIVEMESGAFLQSVADGKEPLFMLGWTNDYPDATNFYDFHFTGASKNFGNAYPDLEAAIKKAATLSDPVERQKAYDEVNTLVKLHVPMVPIAHGGSATAWKKTVEGAHSSPLGNEYMAVMSIAGQDQLVWMQNAEPIMLWCGDETDGESLRACEQVYESLLSFKVGGTEVQPGLAEKYDVNPELTEWTFHLRQGVKFQNGAALDANDVVATYKAQWDYTDPNHIGNTAVFEYFGGFFKKMLNAPAQ